MFLFVLLHAHSDLESKTRAAKGGQKAIAAKGGQKAIAAEKGAANDEEDGQKGRQRKPAASAWPGFYRLPLSPRMEKVYNCGDADCKNRIYYYMICMQRHNWQTAGDARWTNWASLAVAACVHLPRATFLQVCVTPEISRYAQMAQQYNAQPQLAGLASFVQPGVASSDHCVDVSAGVSAGVVSSDHCAVLPASKRATVSGAQMAQQYNAQPQLAGLASFVQPGVASSDHCVGVSAGVTSSDHCAVLSASKRATASSSAAAVGDCDIPSGTPEPPPDPANRPLRRKRKRKSSLLPSPDPSSPPDPSSSSSLREHCTSSTQYTSITECSFPTAPAVKPTAPAVKTEPFSSRLVGYKGPPGHTDPRRRYCECRRKWRKRHRTKLRLWMFECEMCPVGGADAESPVPSAEWYHLECIAKHLPSTSPHKNKTLQRMWDSIRFSLNPSRIVCMPCAQSWPI